MSPPSDAVVAPPALSPEIARHIEAERDSLHEIELGRLRLIAVALAATTLALALAVAFLVYRLDARPVPEPLVMTIDENGAVLAVTDLADGTASSHDATRRSDLANYVIRRERYHWWVLQGDYDAVRLWSSDDVAADYVAGYDGRNARHERLGEWTSVEVRLRYQPILEDDNRATVRFTTITRGSGPDITRHYVATIAFTYDPNAAMTAKQRAVDPRGFQVEAYLVDEEFEESAS